MIITKFSILDQTWRKRIHPKVKMKESRYHWKLRNFLKPQCYFCYDTKCPFTPNHQAGQVIPRIYNLTKNDTSMSLQICSTGDSMKCSAIYNLKKLCSIHQWKVKNKKGCWLIDKRNITNPAALFLARDAVFTISPLARTT